jgi:Fur family transcriptional regulator, peroxide stress response regulator
MEATTTRQTKYCNAIKTSLGTLGHASNSELLAQLRVDFPNLSATTVHRATARLADRGEIAVAPPDNQGAMRYDALVTPHDHFACNSCNLLKDTDIVKTVIPALESQLEGCQISGRLVIYGTCYACTTKKGGKR